MATRNLTKKFEDIRSQYKKKREQNIGRSFGYAADGRAALLPDGEDSERTATEGSTSSSHAGLALAMPPQWVAIVESIHSDMEEIEEKLKKLKELHTARLKVSFAKGAEQEKEKEINIQTQEITRIIKRCESSIKRIALVDNAPGTQLPKEEKQVRLNLMRNLAVSLAGTSKDFRQAQKDFLFRLKSQEEIGTQYFATEEGGVGGMSFEEAAEKGFTKKQQMELKQIELRATEREKEILHVAQSINDLAAIFRELNVLVIEQGTILDRIDYSIEQTLVKVKEGYKEIQTADDYSKKARTIKCIIALILIIIILIGLLIWKYGPKN